ncbi:hypothetical protein GCM10007928_02510 [Sulfitobacter porphyrae]|nr:hypothetical protein GCM10007928_02510 [Sulfitobacter porphyrae]
MPAMMMTDFIREIEDYLERTGSKPSRLGRGFLSDPNFVSRLREGGECRPSTIEKVRAKMAEFPDGPPLKTSQDAA